MITLQINNIYTSLLGDYPRELIDEVCSYRPKNYYFMEAYRNKHWDGIYHLLKSDKFPTGLLNRVVSALESSNIRFTIDDKRKRPSCKDGSIGLKKVKLRDYQIEAIESAIRKERGILYLSCASGKTLLVTALIKALGYPKSLYIVHRLSLMEQARKVISENLNTKVGIIQAKNWDIQPITVATIETLYSKLGNPDILEYLNNLEFTYWDECHTSVGQKKWYTVCNKINSYFRLGGTGSLPTDDERSMKLLSVTGEVIYKVTAKDLEKQGFIAKPIISTYSVSKPSLRKDLTWHEVYELGIVKNNYRNSLIVNISKSLKHNLCLITRLEHGRILEERMRESGIKVKFIQGSNTVKERKQAFDKLESEKLDCVISSSISDEGIDAPRISNVILAGGGASDIKTIQRLGRGMRIAEGKKSFNVIDFIDSTHRILLYHSGRRLRRYKKEGFEVQEGNTKDNLF